MKAKKAIESLAVSTEIVLPNDTNTLGNLMGGRLLHWMDVISAIAAHRHCRRVVVTASVNNVSFNQPIKLADVVTLEAKVSRAFSTSMEVFIDVFVENHSIFFEMLQRVAYYWQPTRLQKQGKSAY